MQPVNMAVPWAGCGACFPQTWITLGGAWECRGAGPKWGDSDLASTFFVP